MTGGQLTPRGDDEILDPERAIEVLAALAEDLERQAAELLHSCGQQGDRHDR